MKKAVLFSIIFLIFCIFVTGSIGNDETPDSTKAVETTNSPRELKPGEVFEENCYIEVDNVKITYDGEDFVIDNNSDSIMLISCGFYGKKADGTYEWIGTPAFSGFDEAQYKKDVEENGWAVKKQTNKVRPGETLTATLTLFDFGEDYPSWDIDGDGYYDINFSLAKQRDESSIVVSTNDTETDYYRLKAK